MNERESAAIIASYDRIAAEYTRRLYHELDNKPIDRAILDLFAAQLAGRGTVCDLGCGPGHIARYLADRGLSMIGVDLSPGMVAQATALNPDIEFYAGNMLSLAVPDKSWAGIVAFYSIIHISREQVAAALAEMRRVLKPNGLLLLAFHMGDEDLHETEIWGQAIDLKYWMYGADEMIGYLEQAGYAIEEVIERGPYAPEVEYQSRRAYILARRC